MAATANSATTAAMTSHGRLLRVASDFERRALLRLAFD
jgi:hypothetical protein